MMQYVLFEDSSYHDLWPLTFTRPTADLRVGIDRLQDKWARALGATPGILAYDYLRPAFDRVAPAAEALFLNAKVVPDASLARAVVEACEPGHYLPDAQGRILAFRCLPGRLGTFDGIVTQPLLEQAGLVALPPLRHDRPAIDFPWKIFQLNGQCLREDFAALTAGRRSEPIADPHTAVYGRDNVFAEPGVKVRAAILNAEDGPIYLGEGAELQEGAIVHGAHAICAHAVLSMGAKMRGDTTVGPWSKVGGEVGNSVIQGYSNKAHDGYLGNSVLGHWCNLGADTNTSNLKNNYTEVRVWNYRQERFARTGTIFCGLIMGDHSKSGINTMFNTGTVVGVSANIFGAGYPRNFIPSFSWGGAGGISTFGLDKSYEVAEAVMARRKVPFTDADKAILAEVFDRTRKYRNWDGQ